VLEIYVDADACPVKSEVYRVAQRYGLSVTLVSNARMRVPQEDWLRLVVVDGQADAADDWIAEQASADDIVISGDIPLAARFSTSEAAPLPRTISARHWRAGSCCRTCATWEPSRAGRPPSDHGTAPAFSTVSTRQSRRSDEGGERAGHTSGPENLLLRRRDRGEYPDQEVDPIQPGTGVILGSRRLSARLTRPIRVFLCALRASAV
jgi:hypothetical protein